MKLIAAALAMAAAAAAAGCSSSHSQPAAHPVHAVHSQMTAAPSVSGTAPRVESKYIGRAWSPHCRCYVKAYYLKLSNGVRQMVSHIIYNQARTGDFLTGDEQLVHAS